jgi:cyanate permease
MTTKEDWETDSAESQAQLSLGLGILAPALAELLARQVKLIGALEITSAAGYLGLLALGKMSPFLWVLIPTRLPPTAFAWRFIRDCHTREQAT